MAHISDIDPIDGNEIKSIILKRIEDQLNRDSTLADDIAYPGFKLDFTINLKFLRSRTEQTLVWGDGKLGNITPTDDQELASETHKDEYETDSPNEAREMHDLPIPITVQTANGMERRKVRGRPPKVKG